MTLYGWDASHYDGPLTVATMRRAAAEGIAFFTHKIGEGTGGDDPLDGTALAAARDAGIEFIGGYHVVRSGPVGPQVDECIALADRDESWWRDYPGWFWQPDLEHWPYDQVSAPTGIAFGNELRRRTGRTVAMYASHGQYGDQLTAWDGPLWNADYVSHPAAGFVAMYPGDNWAPSHGSWRGGWASYSGQAPTFLQYTSSAIIAGLTTCDANAYRGTVEQLRALITGSPNEGDDMTPEQWALIRDAIGRGQAIFDDVDTIEWTDAPSHGRPNKNKAHLNAIDAKLAELEAAIAALAAGGGTTPAGPTHDELVQAAFEGAQRAEQE